MISNMEGALLDIMNAALNGKSVSFTNKSAERCNFGFCHDEYMIREAQHHDYICEYYGDSEKDVQSFAKANESIHHNDFINGHNEDLLFQKLQKWSGNMPKESGSTVEANTEMKKEGKGVGNESEKKRSLPIENWTKKKLLKMTNKTR